MEVQKITTKTNSRGTKDKILELFYEQHKKTTDIAKELNIMKSYVTKITQKDSRYIEEKELRKCKSKEKNKIQKREYIQKKREKHKQEYKAMVEQINKDNKFLSKRKKLSDEQYAKWNRSAYTNDKNSSDIILREDINVGYGIAKRISNRINPNMIKGSKIYV